MRWSTIALALTFLLLPSIGSAHGESDDVNEVHACINKSSKAVRIVGVSGSCSNSETTAHWPGVASTDTDAAGPCFDLTNRYVDCGNGTVTDSLTGLIWLQQVDCFTGLNWLQAQQAAAVLKDVECGLTDGSSPGDWRLPTKDEWSAMTHRAFVLSCVNPVITDDAGTACHSAGGASSFVGDWNVGYWLTATVEDHPTQTWVGLGAGNFFPLDKDPEPGSLPYVEAWLVRGGPP
jgi:hypothetical protein